MVIYDSIIDSSIESFLSSAPRYKVVVIAENLTKEEPTSLDVGKTLATAICGIDRTIGVQFQFAVQETLVKLINEHTQSDELIGEYVIMRNFGILFEPDLNIDIHGLLKSISRNKLVILLWPGVIRQDRLCFLSESSDLYISQSDINYAII